MDEQKKDWTMEITSNQRCRYSAKDIIQLQNQGMKIVSLEELLTDENLLEEAQKAGINLDDLKQKVIVGPGYDDENRIEQIKKIADEIQPTQIHNFDEYYNNRAGRRARTKAEKKRRW